MPAQEGLPGHCAHSGWFARVCRTSLLKARKHLKRCASNHARIASAATQTMRALQAPRLTPCAHCKRRDSHHARIASAATHCHVRIASAATHTMRASQVPRLTAMRGTGVGGAQGCVPHHTFTSCAAAKSRRAFCAPQLTAMREARGWGPGPQGWPLGW